MNRAARHRASESRAHWASFWLADDQRAAEEAALDELPEAWRALAPRVGHWLGLSGTLLGAALLASLLIRVAAATFNEPPADASVDRPSLATTSIEAPAPAVEAGRSNRGGVR